MGYSPWACKESGTTEGLCICVRACTQTHTLVRLGSRQQLEKEVAGMGGADVKEPEACPTSAPNFLRDHLSL